MLSCAIDAKENRYVIVSNIPGTFLHADMDDNVHMLLEGTVAEMIVKLDSTIYRKHIWYNKHGKPMLTSRKRTGQTQQQIQKRKSTYKMLRKGNRISGHENRLLTRKSKIHYIQIH